MRPPRVVEGATQGKQDCGSTGVELSAPDTWARNTFHTFGFVLLEALGSSRRLAPYQTTSMLRGLNHPVAPCLLE